ncbi:MAG: hypothetical protein M5U26_13645 [Planctomycetota bacterium]|nr:hypothetical protein [Planctomycetota bacterium]
MTVERIRQLYNARPFQPFIMHLADGRGIPVEHPEWMHISPNLRTVVVEQRTGTMNVIDLLLVTDLEIRVNGRHGPRKGKSLKKRPDK